MLRSAPDNVTTEMDLELWRVAVRARDDADSASALGTQTARDLADGYRAGTLPAVLQRGMTDFLGRYGHRAVAEIDLGMPRWSDDPAHLFGVLSGYLRLDPDAATPEQHFADGARDARAMMLTLVRRARRRSRLRAVAVRFCLRRARALVGMREMPKFLIVTAMSRARAVMLQIGGELAESGRIAEPEDVFFLDFDETKRAAAGDDLRSRGQRAKGPVRRRAAAPARAAGPAVRRDGTRGRRFRVGGGPGGGASRNARVGRDRHGAGARRSWTRSAPAWSRARSWWHRPPTRAGRRCSSRPAGS